MSEARTDSRAGNEFRQRVEELLRKRCETCSTLMELSQEQKEVIEGEGSVERLMIVLGRKQGLLGELQEIGGELRPLMEEWRRERERIPMAERERISGLAERGREALRVALELEAEVCERIGDGRGLEASQRTGRGQERRAVEAYARGKSSRARLLERGR